MTSITQQIPNYVGGISQQPDELKIPGQVRVAKNVIPDVTHGLLKRPGGRLIGNNLGAYTTDSKWFHYYRDENEQYIGQIQLSTGEIKMWKCDTGAACTVNYESGQATALKNYLKQTNSGGTIIDSDIQTLTLNDYTYLTNRNKTVAMATTTEPVREPEAYLELKKVAYANQYAVNLFDSTTLTEIKTATRISVILECSSNNYCNSSGGMVTRGSRGNSSNDYRCDDTAGDSRDSWAPNVATKIFSISDGATLDDPDAINDTSNFTIDVKDSSGSSVNRGSNLYFRITTTGQSVPYTTGTGDSQETTYQARYTTTHDLLFGGAGWQVGDNFIIWMKDGKYKITIDQISIAKVQGNLGVIRPNPTSFDTKTTVTAESILGDIRSGIVNTNNFTDANVKIVGNGLYITRPTSEGTFNISTPSGDLMNVLSSSIRDIGDLPKQCRHGYVVKVANNEAEEDDYYLKFYGNNDRDGDGVWEECVMPNQLVAYDPATMPIQLIREANGTFTVKQVTWENALVGDTREGGTNPRASFVGNNISKMLFFRNRLVLLSDENVVMSQPGDFFNFWSKTALTNSSADMIDISTSSEYPAIVYDGIQVNAGLILFTKNQQFMLTTDSDILSPITAKINAVSSYNFNFNTNPLSLGTTIAWLDNAGKYTRFFEMQSVLREGQPDIFEQSKTISKLFPKDINLVANSRENGSIFFCTKNSTELYGFRYFQTGERRVQQAWFTWKLNGNIQHIAMLDDALYVVIKNGTTYTMQKFSLKLDDNSHTIVEDDTYRVHLDNSKSFAYTNLTYVASEDYTKFDHTAANFNASEQLYAVAVSTGSDKEFNGLVSKVTTFDDAGTTKIKIPGNWTTSDSNKAFNVVLGYAFDMEVEFPNFYVVQQVGEKFRSDIQSSLVLHRIKMSLGPTGVYNTTLKRTGKPDYNETFESIMADAYTVNTVGIDKEQVVTLPVYEKNTNLTLTLKSNHPTPSTLYSINWEGDYSNKYYKRV